MDFETVEADWDDMLKTMPRRYIIGILDGEESDIGFFGMRKNYIIFPNPKKPYIGRLNIRYCLYSQLFISQQNNLF